MILVTFLPGFGKCPTAMAPGAEWKVTGGIGKKGMALLAREVVGAILG